MKRIIVLALMLATVLVPLMGVATRT